MQQTLTVKKYAIGYASRTLSLAELDYSVTHQKTLATVWTLKNFRDIFLPYPITVFTKHAPVTELFEDIKLNGHLARFQLTIKESGPPLSIY